MVYLASLFLNFILWILTVSVITQLCLMFNHFYAFCNTIVDVLLLQTKNNLLHMTTCNGTFQIKLTILDQTNILTPLVPFCQEIFWEIKENIVPERTNMEFHSFDYTIGFLFFWYIDWMCYMPMLYWAFPHENAKKKTHLNYHFSWACGLKASLLTPLAPFHNEYFLRN